MTDHVRTSYRNHRRATWGLVIAVVVAIAVVLVPLGAAKPPSSEIKKFAACLQYGAPPAPNCSTAADTLLPGGAANAAVTLTLKNDPTSNQTLGSANLDVPAGSEIKIVSTDQPSQGTASRTDGQLRLRELNLAINSSVTVTFYVSTPCAGSNLQWGPDLVTPAGPVVKQSNQFLGTGNDFTLTFASGLRSDIEPCFGLRFVNQPAKTVVGATITDADYSNGAPIAVGLYSAEVPLDTCPASVGNVTIAKDQADGDLSGNVAALTGSPCVATFDDLAISDVSSLPQEYTLTASGPGSLVPESGPFDVIDGTDCVGQNPCLIGPFQTDNTKSTGRATGGNFTFVAFDSLDLGGRIPAGCAGFQTVGADAIYIAEGRSGLSGELFVTYGIKKSLIQKKYGNNSGQQFIPICAGAKRIELVGGRTQAVNCNASYGDDELSQADTGWWGKQLDLVTGKFTGRLAQAKCDDTGFFFGIIGSFQDYTNSDPCRVIDSATSPTVVEWTSDTTYRYFTSRWPSSSATPPPKVTDSSCPATTAAPAPFADIPWDGYKGG